MSENTFPAMNSTLGLWRRWVGNGTNLRRVRNVARKSQVSDWYVKRKG